jgi:glutamate dehydrogenase
MVLGCLAKAGLKEENVTKFQTGGPDGDLGSNEILLSKDKTVAIVDGSGVAYDPKGLDREELSRLAKSRQMIGSFSKSKLGPGGFVVLIAEKDVRLPNGEVVENGRTFRDTFHLHPLAQADFFVPCGGRPEAVNLSNVDKLFDERGKPKFKYVIEGANLFLTQDARMVLEKAGVVLYKDASANKGGVTSSSMEVLAALSMDDAEFHQHMMVPGTEYPPKSYPPFYKKYVEEIQSKIVHNAALEFECIWLEHERSAKPRCLLTDEVSEKINQLNHSIQRSALWDNLALRKRVLAEAIPKSLQELLGLDKIMERVPPNYQKAIFGAFLASTFVYKNGISGGNEFKFFEFMAHYTK